jgi:N6-adenosine-specific RNA methylase IME4
LIWYIAWKAYFLNNHRVSTRTLSQSLMSIDDALRALAEARTPKQLIGLANTAEALRRYAQRSRLGLIAQNRCAELRLRAERKLGEYLAGTPRNLGGRPKPVPFGNGFPTLDDLGITRKLSHRAQRLAAIPAKDFDWYLRTAAAQECEITTRLLLYHAERRQAKAKNRQRIIGGRIDDLIEFAAAGNRMGCIVVDPPWPILGSTLPYEAIEVDELRDLPIPDLAAERCHLHLWTLPNPYHFAAYEVIRHWGFRVVSEFVWCKTQLGKGHYWRMSHEILLTAVRTEDDRFDDLSLRSWIVAQRGRDSEKPEAIREFLERASPGPRPEIYARKLVEGWYAWGHEIAESLTDQTAA